MTVPSGKLKNMKSAPTGNKINCRPLEDADLSGTALKYCYTNLKGFPAADIH